MSDNNNRDYHEELLLNSGGSITKTIHNINVNATAEQIKDIVLHNHSNLNTASQRLHAFNSIQQKPDKALQTYNSQYESHFWLAYPAIRVVDTGSRTQCIHYASLLHGKLGDEMEARFSQDLPKSLQASFEKAVNFEPHILTKQTINTRRINEVNQINVTHYDEDFEVNKNLTIKVRTMILTIKIKTKTTVIIIIPAAAPATQGLDITSTATKMGHQKIPRAHSRISQPMCK